MTEETPALKLLIAPFVELKFNRSRTYVISIKTFNRTICGIEMMEHSSMMVKNMQLLIAPFVELKLLN